MMVFSQRSLEPRRIAGSFPADSGRTRKRSVKLLGFSVLMFQPTIDNLAGRGIQHGYLLEWKSQR